MPLKNLFRNNDYYSPSFDYYSQGRKFDWNSMLNNTQRTLSIINSAIPLVNQVRPMLSNTSTMLKIYREMSKSDNNLPTENTEKANNIPQTNTQRDNGPKFFI